MRHGHLLAEAAPEALMRHFNSPSMEDVFLRLCLSDGDIDEIHAGVENANFASEEKELAQVNKRGASQSQMATSDEIVVEKHPKSGKIFIRQAQENGVYKAAWVSPGQSQPLFSAGRCSALTIKNFIRMKRNVGFLLFSFLLPVIQTVLFCLTVGGMPHDLPVAFSILDEGIGESILNTSYSLSSLYIKEIDDHIIAKNYYDSYERGYNSVLDGQTWGLVFIPENYTRAVVAVTTGLNDAFDPKDSNIYIFMDNTNQQISWTIQINLFKAFEKYIVDIATNILHHDPERLSLPIIVGEPIYGSENPSFTEFMAPGIILTISFFMAVGLTATSYITDQKEGLYDRSKVAGVLNSEVMLAHLGAQMSVVVVQVALVLLFMFPVFKIPCEGNILWVILLALLQGLCGMSLGLLVSVAAGDEMTAMLLSLGLFYIVLLLSGILWPIQGMPVALSYIAYVLPLTYPCDSIRSILYRGWNISYFEVYIGYIITFVWLLIFLSGTLTVLKVKK